VDDFALQPLDTTATADFYELVVARHRETSTVLTSNREPSEWLAMMSDPLLAQSAVDRLTATAHELVIEGDSYRRRQKPTSAGARGARPVTPARRQPRPARAARCAAPGSPAPAANATAHRPAGKPPGGPATPRRR